MTATLLDRATGTRLASAAGDALGAGYEFGPPLPDDQPVHMAGGGTFGWAPGEWTDDTSMAVPIAQVLADGVRWTTRRRWTASSRHGPDGRGWRRTSVRRRARC